MISYASMHTSDLYDIGGCDTADPPGAIALVGILLGADSVVPTSKKGVTEACLFRRGPAKWSVGVPDCLWGAALNMSLARTLARWYLITELAYEAAPPDVEDFASSILLPDAAVRVAIREFGPSANAIAEWLDIPAGVVAVRIRDVFTPEKSGHHRAHLRLVV